MGNFHQLEVVDRGSETQLQAGEHLNYLFQRITWQYTSYRTNTTAVQRQICCQIL